MVSNVLLDDTARLMGAPASGRVEGVEGEEEEEVLGGIAGMQQLGVLGKQGGGEGWKGEEEGEDGGDRGVAISGSEFQVMEDFFEEMEARWRGRVRYEHIQAECERVARAAARYNEVVKRDLMPFVNRSRSLSSRTSITAAKKVEIAAYRDYGVLLKGTRAKALVSAQDPSDPLHALVQQLVPAAVDSKGKKAGDGWYSTAAADEALSEYKDAVAAAHLAVVAALQKLSSELQPYLSSIVAVANFCIVARTLDAHVRCGLPA
ncbi:unnamed protein product [Closterium sp. NIES-54]